MCREVLDWQFLQNFENTSHHLEVFITSIIDFPSPFPVKAVKICFILCVCACLSECKYTMCVPEDVSRGNWNHKWLYAAL